MDVLLSGDKKAKPSTCSPSRQQLCLHLELAVLMRPAGQQSPGVHWSLDPRAGITGMLQIWWAFVCLLVWSVLFYFLLFTSVLGQNSSPQVHVTNTLLRDFELETERFLVNHNLFCS